MPPFKFLASFGGHGFGHVVVVGRDGSHVPLVVGPVELMREVPFCQFRQSKGLGKAARGIWKKLRESMKRRRSCLTSKSLHPFRSCSTRRLSLWYWWTTKYPSYPWKLWAKHIDLTRVVLHEGIQLFEKISNTMLAWETNGAIVVFGFGHDQIGYVLFPGLHGLNVKKHVKGRSGVVHVFLLLLHFIGL